MRTAFAATLLLPGLIQAAATGGDPAEFFETRVRPVLAKNCFACHTASKMGGLEFQSQETLLKGGKSGPAIVPGDPDKSLLIQAIRQTHERLKMPPSGKLADTEIAAIETWIRNGAIWPEGPKKPAGSTYSITPEQRAFWSFQPVRKPAPPEVRDSGWATTPIDRFVLHALEAKGLKPVAPADRRTLLRRVTFDLTGLPPTPEEVDAFLHDRSPDAFARVVDRLLASPQYGERWGRFWLDVARYSDDQLNSTQDAPRPNAFRYRDWVIKALNDDMPYNLFVKAQLAGDLMPDKARYEPGLAFYALSPEFQDDRVDATTRGFLGLTVACAQCHDHKFDPIPQKSYYALLGVFKNTKYHETPLAPPDVVREYDEQKARIEKQEKTIQEFLERQRVELSRILAYRTADYIREAAAADPKAETAQLGLDEETAERWRRYLKRTDLEHPFKPAADPDQFQQLALDILTEKKKIDDENFVRLGGSSERGTLSQANLLSLERDRYIVWRDLFEEKKGLFSYPDTTIARFLEGKWKEHLTSQEAKLELLKKDLPAQYPFLHTIRDVEKPADIHVYIRGNPQDKGEIAPRKFLAILSKGEPRPLTHGSGRLDLAEAIADPENPLTARVIVNRIWLHHFGRGLVGTPGNFGQLGERPTHPQLLDYLASRLVEQNWSLKALHREIVLSATYALSVDGSKENEAVDPDNHLLWRANRQRLDVEALRDSLLFAAGTLDLSVGGPAEPLDEKNHRRTVYGFVSRRKLDGLLSLFDFPNPNNLSEQRMTTNVPLQRLFFLNSPLIESQSEAFAARLKGSNEDRIRQAYRILYGRNPDAVETNLGKQFLAQGSWPEYAQTLLSSNEFLYVD